MARYFPSGLSATAVGKLLVGCGPPGAGNSSTLLEGSCISLSCADDWAVADKLPRHRTRATQMLRIFIRSSSLRAWLIAALNQPTRAPWRWQFAARSAPEHGRRHRQWAHSRRPPHRHERWWDEHNNKLYQ